MRFLKPTAKTGLVAFALLTANVGYARLIIKALPDIERKMAMTPAGDSTTMQRCVGMDWQSAPKLTENRFCRRYRVERTSDRNQATETWVADGEPFMLGPEIPAPNRASDGQMVSTADRLFPPSGSMPNSMTMRQPVTGAPLSPTAPTSRSRYMPPVTGGTTSLDGNTSTPVVNAINAAVQGLGAAFGVGQSRNTNAGSGRASSPRSGSRICDDAFQADHHCQK